MPKLLVVDDDKFSLTLTQATLEGAGYAVEVAEDGEIAWQIMDTAPNDFDLILLDKCMPKLDGLDLLKRIKSDLRFKDLPVVMLTGATQEQDIVDGLAAGAHYYLTKPSPEEILTSVIKNALLQLQNKRELLSSIGHQTEALRILTRAEFSFSNLQEAKTLALWLADASMVPERTVNAYSELLVNAVEHGNLEISYQQKSQLLIAGRWEEEIAERLQQDLYAQRRVTVTMLSQTEHYIVIIKDEGKGFDWTEYLDFSPERAFDLHGRGIAMARKMGLDSIEYQGNGNTVVTMVKKMS